MFIDNDGLMPAVIIAIAVLMVAITFGILLIDSKAEKKGATFEKPKFFSASKNEFTVFSVGGYGGRKDWYLTKNKDVSIYFSGFNLYGNMSINYKGKDKSTKDIFNINASIFDFGYDGRYLDISVAGGLSTDSFSIDLWQIINDIVNLFKEGEN